MKLSYILLLAVRSLAAPARNPMSVPEVFQLVSEHVALDYNDEATAHDLEAVDLKGRLTPESIQILKNEGAGPLTLRVLANLGDASASAPSPASLQPSPDLAGEQALLQKITAYASNYVRSLPDFLCTEKTTFFTSGHPPGPGAGKKDKLKATANWRLDQTIVEDLGYYEKAEHHRTRLVDNVPDTRPIGKIRGSFSRGEFGNVIDMTFDPGSHTQFKWDHWETLHDKRLAVLSYFVGHEYSQYKVCCSSSGVITVHGVLQKQYKSWLSAYRGLFYADPDSGAIVRFTLKNVDLPSWFDLDASGNVLDYASIALGEQTYWLPVKAIHHTRTANYRTRDEIEFSNYQKFSADSTILFR